MSEKHCLDLNKNGKMDVYEDPSQPVDARVEDLLGQMTLEEKLGQLSQVVMEGNSDEVHADILRQGRVGSFLPAWSAIGKADLRNRLQKLAVEESRLGIPFLMGFDAIHGFRTIFPIPLGMAAAWEPELFTKAHEVSAFEATATGIDWSFAPMVDLARDPRWGRISEGFGEDPYLGGLYAAASVKGFQGDDPADRRHVVSCLKHYVGYGAAEGGRDYNTTDVSEYQLRNNYLPQFHAGVKAGAMTLMSAFNCLNGIPTSGNRHTLTEILRDEWGFTGFVVSDWASVLELVEQGIADGPAQAAKIALEAGVDMEMVTSSYIDTLGDQLASGGVSQETIDNAVRNVLRIKFERGIFENPYVDETWQEDAFLKPEALKLAQEVAAKSCVLLKNEEDQLPLVKDGLKLALIGPLVSDKDELLGSWAGFGKGRDVVTLEEGIRAKLGPNATLTVCRGCDLTTGRRTITKTDGSIVEDPDAPVDQVGDQEFAAAIEAAQNADVVVMALGEPRGWSGENATRTELGLTGRQEELFNAAAAAGKPIIVVLFGGRPMSVVSIQEKAQAVLMAWQPGVQGGNAIADLLFGDQTPSGKITATFPRTVGQVPVHYNHFNTGRPQYQEYRDSTHLPLYPFGHGLSYTSFEYSDVELSSTSISKGERITASATIKNTGKRAGTEVVQLYIRDIAASRVRPIRELKGFSKIELEPGESRKVSFDIGNEQLSFIDENGNVLVEPGKFAVWISKDSASGESAQFELKL